jgi:hypothetical protein
LASLDQKVKRVTWERQEAPGRMDIPVRQVIEDLPEMWAGQEGLAPRESQVSQGSSQEQTRGRREAPACQERTDLTEDAVTRVTRDSLDQRGSLAGRGRRGIWDIRA